MTFNGWGHLTHVEGLVKMPLRCMGEVERLDLYEGLKVRISLSLLHWLWFSLQSVSVHYNLCDPQSVEWPFKHVPWWSSQPNNGAFDNISTFPSLHYTVCIARTVYVLQVLSAYIKQSHQMVLSFPTLACGLHVATRPNVRWCRQVHIQCRTRMLKI